MSAPYVLGGLLIAAGTYYLISRIRFRRARGNQTYQAQTSTRIEHAGWRTHGNVTYLGGGYVYAPTKTTEQQEGGGSHGQRLEAQLGVVSPRSLGWGPRESRPTDLRTQPVKGEPAHDA